MPYIPVTWLDRQIVNTTTLGDDVFTPANAASVVHGWPAISAPT